MPYLMIISIINYQKENQMLENYFVSDFNQGTGSIPYKCTTEIDLCISARDRNICFSFYIISEMQIISSSF